MSENFKQRLNRIRAFAFDIDGVLTDGIVSIGSDNTITRHYNAKDAYAITTAARSGYILVVISKASEPLLKDRLGTLGFQEVYLSCTDKEETLKDFATVYSIKEEEILYMGDDMPDYGAMQRAGVAACPHDAVADIRAISQYISPYKGGKGCVRDVIEQVMRLHGKW
jgi:3-deoxy-D-manno-octulosonate 8-phosphate phosphatase (KDO 8-P phosphatase)